MAPAEDPRICRFCLEPEAEPPPAPAVESNDEADEIIAPCRCEGSSKWVHTRCLQRWQCEIHDARARICQVCQSHFSLQPSATRPSILRTTSTNPHYDRAAVGMLPPGRANALLDLMRAGNLILQSPAQAQRSDTMASHLGNASDPMTAIVQAILRSRSEHWLRGVYLILHREPDRASDGTDIVVAVNVTRPAPQPLPREAALFAERGVPSRLLCGGPCGVETPLCIVSVWLATEGGEFPRPPTGVFQVSAGDPVPRDQTPLPPPTMPSLSAAATESPGGSPRSALSGSDMSLDSEGATQPPEIQPVGGHGRTDPSPAAPEDAAASGAQDPHQFQVAATLSDANGQLCACVVAAPREGPPSAEAAADRAGEEGDAMGDDFVLVTMEPPDSQAATDIGAASEGGESAGLLSERSDATEPAPWAEWPQQPAVYVGEVGVVAPWLQDVLLAEVEGRRRYHVEAHWVSGYAVWSSQQLLAEMARGSWGLCAANLQSVLSGRRDLWETLWRDNHPTLAAYDPPPTFSVPPPGFIP